MTVFLRISTWALIPKLTLDERHLGDGGESLNRGGAYSNIDRKNIEEELRKSRLYLKSLKFQFKKIRKLSYVLFLYSYLHSGF